MSAVPLQSNGVAVYGRTENPGTPTGRSQSALVRCWLDILPMAAPTTAASSNSRSFKPIRNGSQLVQVAADFTKPTTRNEADDLDDEMNSLDTVEHPLFDALQREPAHIVQQRIFTP